MVRFIVGRRSGLVFDSAKSESRQHEYFSLAYNCNLQRLHRILSNDLPLAVSGGNGKFWLICTRVCLLASGQIMALGSSENEVHRN